MGLELGPLSLEEHHQASHPHRKKMTLRWSSSCIHPKTIINVGIYEKNHNVLGQH